MELGELSLEAPVHIRNRFTSIVNQEPFMLDMSTDADPDSLRLRAGFPEARSGGRLRVGNDIYRPIGMKGWYHAVFGRDSDGQERLLSIDQLLEKMNDWI